MTRPAPKFSVGEWVVRKGATTRGAVQVRERHWAGFLGMPVSYGGWSFGWVRGWSYRIREGDLCWLCEPFLRPLPPPERADDEFTEDLTRWLGQAVDDKAGVS